MLCCVGLHGSVRRLLEITLASLAPPPPPSPWWWPDLLITRKHVLMHHGSSYGKQCCGGECIEYIQRRPSEMGVWNQCGGWVIRLQCEGCNVCPWWCAPELEPSTSTLLLSLYLMSRNLRRYMPEGTIKSRINSCLPAALGILQWKQTHHSSGSSLVPLLLLFCAFPGCQKYRF